MSPTKPKEEFVSPCGKANHTVKDAAECHAVSTSEIRRGYERNELPIRRRGESGRAIIIRCKDLEAWIDATSVPNLAEPERGA